MQIKIFHSSNRKELESFVNEWLKTHPVSPDSMRFEFSTVAIEDEISYRLEHTLILFYVPMRTIG